MLNKKKTKKCNTIRRSREKRYMSAKKIILKKRTYSCRSKKLIVANRHDK